VDIADWASPAPGANDNATGVAVLLEVARQLATYEPRATIYLVAFAAEETGLQGSRHFVESGRAPDVRAMVALDIVGNSSGPTGSNALRVFSAGPEDSGATLATWLAGLAQLTPSCPSVRRSTGLDALDHVPFSGGRHPIGRLIEDENTPSSGAPTRPDRIDPAYLRRGAIGAGAVTLGRPER
jgi:Zn-dependent M28 family amino/carboxypeptidase